MPGNGWCTHPKRQHSSDVKILVRKGELACRNSWGGDLFHSKYDDEPRPESGADLPGESGPTTSAPLEDEVTSVITPPDRSPASSRNDDEDRVVSDRPAPHRDNPREEDDDTRNDAACQDQDERARVMARGSRDAVRHARERHLHRRSRFSGTADEPSDDDDDPSINCSPVSGDRVVTQQVSFTHTNRHESPGGYRDASDGPVPRAEVQDHLPATSSTDRFDSVPEVDPSFDLPGWRNRPLDSPNGEGDHDQLPDSSNAVEPAEEPSAHADELSSYEHVMDRARRIRESKKSSASRIQRARARTVVSEVETHTYTAAPAKDDDTEGDTAAPATDEPETTGTEHVAPEVTHLDEPSSAPAEIADYEPAVSSEVTTADSPTHEAVDAGGEVALEETRQRKDGGWLAKLGIPRRPRRTSTQVAPDAFEHSNDSWESSLQHDMDINDVPRSYGAPTPDHDKHAPALGDDRIDDREDDVDPVEAWTTHDSSEYASEPLDSDWPNPGDAGYDSEGDDGWTAASSSFGYLPERSNDTGASLDEEDHVDTVDPRRAEARMDPFVELPDLDDNLFSETFERTAQRRRPSIETVRHAQEGVTTEQPVAQRQPGEDTRERRHANLNTAPQNSLFRAGLFPEWNPLYAQPANADDTSHPGIVDNRYDGHEDVPEYDVVEFPDIDEEFDLKELVARGGELIDMTIDIAPDITRQCRTCRSFRSADGGSRGWCTNEWAFTHRRMVNEDDLACDTTIGCWWLPADRYWIAEDQNGYAAPTPRMDRLIERDKEASKRKSFGA